MRDCRDHGGYLTLADLENYQVIERQPLTWQYRGNTFLTNPPPSSGGALIAFTLALLAKMELSQLKFGSLEHLQALANAMRLTNIARKDGYDARLYDPDVAEQFLAPAHLAAYVHQLSLGANKWGSTTHVSVIDAEGNAASATTSNGEGSSYVIPGTQIMVNNMLGEADLHPNGFHQWQENVRISSMMAPTMVLNQQHPEIVLGSGGSNRIRTAIVQVISNIIDFHMSVEDAVDASRIHWEEGIFSLEPGLDVPEGDRDLFPCVDQVVSWQEKNMFFGGVHAVRQTATGELEGAGDPRRGGAIATC